MVTWWRWWLHDGNESNMMAVMQHEQPLLGELSQGNYISGNPSYMPHNPSYILGNSNYIPGNPSCIPGNPNYIPGNPNCMLANVLSCYLQRLNILYVASLWSFKVMTVEGKEEDGAKTWFWEEKRSKIVLQLYFHMQEASYSLWSVSVYSQLMQSLCRIGTVLCVCVTARSKWHD